MSIKPRDKNKEKQENKPFYKEKQGRYSFLKEQKAKIILSRENAIRKVSNYKFLVRSQTGYGWYKVQWNGKHWICNCPDFEKNGQMGACKHVIALKLRFEHGHVIIEDQEPEIEKKTYSQNWPLYNKARSLEFEYFDKLLFNLVSSIEEPEREGAGRPHLPLSDQIFCCIMKVYSKKDLRTAKWLYKEAMERSQISKAPHYNAVSKTLCNPKITPILHDLVRQSVLPLSDIETCFSVDSSGFRCSTFGHYCEEKHGTKRIRNWLKAHACMGVETNIVTDIVITGENAGDSPQFPKLIKNTAEYFVIKEVSADPAYSSGKNHRIVDAQGGKAYILFKKNATGKTGGALWRKTFHYFQLHKEEFMKHYHKRSNAESTFSAIKMKFGETIKSRNRVAQVNELLCKIIAYNITVLIQEMIQLGVDSEFLSFDGLQKEEVV